MGILSWLGQLLWGVVCDLGRAVSLIVLLGCLVIGGLKYFEAELMEWSRSLRLPQATTLNVPLNEPTNFGMKVSSRLASPDAYPMRL